MLIRQMARWLSYLGVAGCAALTVAACGSGTHTSNSGGVGGAGGAGGGNGGGDGGLTLLDGGNACTPMTCATAGYTCGMNGDGCGGILDCGSCDAPEYCGGGGYSKCGGGVSGRTAAPSPTACPTPARRRPTARTTAA